MTRSAHYVGDRTFAVEDTDAGAARTRERCASTSRTPASAAPTCTSCTAPWTTGSSVPAVIGHEMSGRIAAIGAGRRGLVRR